MTHVEVEPKFLLHHTKGRFCHDVCQKHVKDWRLVLLYRDTNVSSIDGFENIFPAILISYNF